MAYFIPPTAKEKSIRDWKHFFLTVQNYEASAALIVFLLFGEDSSCVG